ncbi:AbrB/MazE/SpoVT family DNA-binding domain-containing protein [Candidatus Daviesbacteria bacterium]|nr:AbrB/MazE/SpoVT family DNA-binding domain-containing protein [Candidatus Daviesbacteria bacterium]MBI4035333.1 AbrB/MazE/SpoVT family DNA-binding domain-containing protein [Candidatus Daviesbacteria bacterium]
MVYTVSVTSQGQISIPAKLRRKLGFGKNKLAFIEEKDGKLILEPVKDLLELGGSLKSNKKPLSDSQVHELFSDYIVKEYARKDKKR